MKVTIETSKEFIDVGQFVDDKRIQLSRYIYEEIDKAVIQNMPQEMLEVTQEKLMNEITRRQNENSPRDN